MKQRGTSPVRRNSLVRTPVQQDIHNRAPLSVFLHCSCRYRQSRVGHSLMPGPKWQLPDLPQRGQVLSRMASQGEVSWTHTVSVCCPVQSLACGGCSLPGGFAVHGQSVKQTQARASPLESSIRRRSTPQPTTSRTKVWATSGTTILQ